MPDWADGGGGARAPAAARGRRRATCASATSWRATRSGRACRSRARRRLHAEILDALLAADADPADIVHHAEAAGAEDVVAEYALVAARRAAALESNREAYSHYRARLGLRRPAAARRAGGACSRSWRQAAYAVGRLDEAFAAIERAIAIYGELGDEAAVGRCTRVLSRFHWFAGDGDAARARRAREAIAILEPLGESVELARAYSGVSQLAMLAEDGEEALEWGERALELATRLGDERTRAHALVNIGSARLQVDRGETATLLEAHAIADAAGDRHEAARALGNLGYTLHVLGASRSRRCATREQALAYAREHEVHTLASYAATMVAWLRLRAGDVGRGRARRTRRDRARRSTVPQLLAKTVLAELAVRRGDPDAAERLADLVAQADRAGEPQRIVPALELAAEWALTNGAPMPVERFAPRARRDRPGRATPAAMRCGRPPGRRSPGSTCPGRGPMPAPHAAMLRRDWAAAADAFGDVGWDYDRALMLSLLDDEESLAEALEIARGLGAEPLTRRVARRMRELGLARPARPARGDARQPGRADRAPARGARAARRRAHERRDRRAARRLAADRRAPRRRGADEARRDDRRDAAGARPSSGCSLVGRPGGLAPSPRPRRRPPRSAAASPAGRRS